MATLCAFDSFVITTGAIGTTFTRVFTDSGSGVTFQPTFVFLFWSGHPFGGSGIGRQDMQQGRGFAISPTVRGLNAALSEDGVGTSNCTHNLDRIACVAIGSLVSSASAGRLDVDAVLVNGMRFIIDEVFAQPISVGLLALGGDLASAALVDYLAADDVCATDPIDVTGFGFDPVMGLGLGDGQATLGPDGGTNRINVEAFRSVAEQGAWCGASDSGVATSDTARYERFGDIALARIVSSGSVRFRNTFNALITDGFRFNCVEDNNDLFVLAGLLGGSFSIEEFVTRTSIGDITLTPGFETSGGIIMSVNTTEAPDNNSPSVPKQNSMSIGAFSGIGVLQGCYYAFDLDGVGTTQVTAGRRDSVYMRGDEAASPALAGSIDVTAIGATTVTLNQSVADPTAAHCIAILFGTRGAVPATGLVPNMRLLGVGQ